MATVDDFSKIEMKIGTILTAEHIPGADKLLKLSVDFGPREKSTPIETPVHDDAGVNANTMNPEIAQQERDIRQILSGIREFYQPEELVGKQYPFITNLPPRVMRGLTSYGMILAVGVAGGGAVLLQPDKEVPPGSTLR